VRDETLWSAHLELSQVFLRGECALDQVEVHKVFRDDGYQVGKQASVLGRTDRERSIA